MTLAVQQALMPVGESLDRHPGDDKRERTDGLPMRRMAEGNELMPEGR